MIHRFTRPHEPLRLTDEIIAGLQLDASHRAGVNSWSEDAGATFAIEIPDAAGVKPAAVRAIVDAHDPNQALRTVAMRELRRERNRRLAESDWTQLADAPVDKTAWALYRQQLRDLPTATSDPRAPVWPVVPGPLDQVGIR